RAASSGGWWNRPSVSARMYRPVPPTTTGCRPAARICSSHAAASPAKRPALYGSPGGIRSTPTVGARARRSRSGFAVPMSSPRYTCRASAEMMVTGSRAAHAAATAVFPTAVGPTSTGTRGGRASGSPKASLQLILWKVHDRGPPMHMVCGEGGGKQPHHELAQFVRLETLARLDRRATGIGRGEALEAVGPAAEPTACQI